MVRGILRARCPVPLLCAVLGLSALLAGCAPSSVTVQNAAIITGQTVPGGNPERGSQAIQRYGCGACHSIPGVPGADGKVGPPLTDWAQRSVIAGRLANTTDNLVRWIQDPQGVSPGTDMPNMGVSDAEARDIAAYLYTIQ